MGTRHGKRKGGRRGKAIAWAAGIMVSASAATAAWMTLGLSGPGTGRDPGTERFLARDFQGKQNLSPALFQDKLLREIAEVAIRRRLSKVAVHLHDFRTLSDFRVNEREVFRVGSLIKVAALIAALKRCERDPDLIKAKFRYDAARFPATQTWDLPFFHGSPDRRLEDGREYGLDDLLYRMAALSGNQAFEVVANLAKTRLFELLDAFSMPPLGTTPPTGTVSDYTRLFSALFYSIYLRPAGSRKALAILAQSDFHDGIELGLPAGTRVAHKFGVYEGSSGEKDLHDCGIVYSSGDHPYSLCVMTQSQDFREQSAAIGEISKAAYEAVEGMPGGAPIPGPDPARQLASNTSPSRRK